MRAGAGIGDCRALLAPGLGGFHYYALMSPSAPLTFNPRNAVTASITRETRHGIPAICKRISAQNRADTPVEWRASIDPAHWNFWRREAEVYGSALAASLDGTGVRLAQVLAIEALDDVNVALWLEDVSGRTGFDLTLMDYVLISRAWGRAQARLIDAGSWLEKPWTSRGFVRAYASSKPVNYALLDDAGVWRQPLIENHWPAGLAAGLRHLYTQREVFFNILERSRQVPSHLDFWPNNVLVDAQGQVVPVDWAFFGSGALGEDVGNFIPDAVFDGFMPASELPRAAEQMLAAYVEGLREGGLDFSEDAVRRNVYASAVKYVWLGPLLLERAQRAEHFRYGDEPLDDAGEQYAERGRALAFLCDWARQAGA